MTEHHGQPPDGNAGAAGAQIYAMPIGALELNLGFMFGQWILWLVTPTVIIDGYPQKRGWGRHFIELAPGNHYVHVSFPYLFNKSCGPAQAMVPVHPGMVTRLDYESPFFIFSNGTFRMWGPFYMPPKALPSQSPGRTA